MMMSTQQETERDRLRLSPEAQEEQFAKVPPNKERVGQIQELGRGVLQSKAVQLGVGVLTATAAGLFLVSMAGVGGAAVAGGAGYLAYREMSGKKKE